MIEELKKILSNCSPEDREKIRKWLWEQKEEMSPTVSCKMGQIVSWTNTEMIPFVKEVGFALDDNHEQKSIIVMQYLQEYKCFRQTRVDADRRDLKIHDAFVDLSEVFRIAEEN